MTDWLVNTNVISELVRPRPTPKGVAFLERTSGLHLSVVTLHEIAYGADRAPDPVRRVKADAARMDAVRPLSRLDIPAPRPHLSANPFSRDRAKRLPAGFWRLIPRQSLKLR